MHFLAIPERRSNGQATSNGHIALWRRSPILHGFVVPVRFKLCKPASCEVFSINSCCFYNLSFFLLRFLSFFPMIWVSLTISGFLFPFLFLVSLIIVTSQCLCTSNGFKVNILSLTTSWVDLLSSYMDSSLNPSCTLPISTTNSLAFCCFNLTSHSSINQSIFLAMKSLSSFFFFSVASSSAFLLI